MTQNRKFGLITLFGIFLPIFLAFLNYYKSNLKNFEWGYDHEHEISTAALIVAIIGCVIILIQNNASRKPNNLWRTTIATILIILSFYLFLGYSFNFGF